MGWKTVLIVKFSATDFKINQCKFVGIRG